MACPKMWSIRPGDRMVPYGGFACVQIGTVVTVEQDEQGDSSPARTDLTILKARATRMGVASA
jgi:hypothetical protein